jgi:chemotaxis protein histidine kinase CheA
VRLNAEVSPEELKVFLEETEELIELMDTCIIRMEKEQEKQRTAAGHLQSSPHDKGSSAMVGFTPMAELTTPWRASSTMFAITGSP